MKKILLLSKNYLKINKEKEYYQNKTCKEWTNSQCIIEIKSMQLSGKRRYYSLKGQTEKKNTRTLVKEEN